MIMENLKKLLFRTLHGFRGYPKEIYGIPFRVDESLRRFKNGGEEVVQEVLKAQLKAGDVYVDVGGKLRTAYDARSSLCGRIGQGGGL